MVVNIYFKERGKQGISEMRVSAPTILQAKQAFRHSYPNRSIINAVRVG